MLGGGMRVDAEDGKTGAVVGVIVAWPEEGANRREFSCCDGGS
jgi:hypothetical protein